MIAKVQNDFQTPNAFRFYGIILILAIVSSVGHYLWDIFISSNGNTHLVYMFLTVGNVVCYVMKKRRATMAYSVFVFALLQILAFVAIWLLDGGIQGPASTLYFTLAVVFIVVLPETYKLAIVIFLCLILLFLSQFFSAGLGGSNFIFEWLWIDYILNSVVIGVTLVYFKEGLDGERKLLFKYNNHIADVAFELVGKKEELVNQRTKIEDMTSNLEDMIVVSTYELALKNKELSKCAFDNAHILRAPLSNILGMIEVLKLEMTGGKGDSEELFELQNKAEKLDEMVKKINEILK
ncbi:MAG: hypothetical protein OCD76_11230 [Reichenbachiella sp.]